MNNRTETKPDKKYSLVGVVAIAAIFGVVALFIITPERIFRLVMPFIAAAAILISDDGGLRRALFHNPDSRLRLLNRNAKTESRTLEIIKTVFYISLLLALSFRETAFIFTGISLLLALVGFFLYLFGKDKCSFLGYDKAHPSALIKMLLVYGLANILLLVSPTDMDINVLYITVAATVAAVLLALIFAPEKSAATILTLAAVMACFSLGAALAVNKDFDFSSEQTYRVTVTDKRVSGGKTSTHYLITESGSGDANVTRRIVVFPADYNATGYGDVLKVTVKKGLLGMEYTYIDWWDRNDT